MDYVIWGCVAVVAAIVLFSVLNYALKVGRAPKSAEQGIWNAVYFLQLKQYKRVLSLLEETESEFSLTPAAMSDLCVQRAAAYLGLGKQDLAADTYNVLLDVLKNSDGRIKQNEAFFAEIRECYASCQREAEFEAWEAFFANPPEYVDFRPATKKDLARAAEIYGKIHDEEEAGNTTTGWIREVYPTRATAEAAIANNDFFVAEVDGVIVATARINKEQVDVYAAVDWEYPAEPEQVMVLHTLVVDPAYKGRGYGKKFVAFYEEYALENDCPYLRIDTNARNTAARAMYKKLGYKEVGTVPCAFNGIEGVELVCLEKKL